MTDVNLSSLGKARPIPTLADRIAADIEAHFSFGRSFPVALTLSALADHYHVSVTPIRHALARLIEAKTLVKLPNGRFAPSDSHRANGASTAFESVTPTESLEAALEREVILLGLTGKEGFLREEAAANRFAVSRTLIRQALGCLVGRGFIEHVPRRGWRVRTFQEDDMLAYLDVRELLESKALELARPHLVVSDLKGMRSSNRPGASPQLDNSLHTYWIDKSGNRYIQNFFAHHGVYYSALFDHAALEAEFVAEMAAQHCDILDALIRRQWAKARRALVEHIRAQKPVVRRLIAIASQKTHAVS